MSCRRPRKRRERKMAFSMSADARKDTHRTSKKRMGAVDVIRLKSAGGSVTDDVLVRRRERIPIARGCLRRVAKAGL